ncbi:S8/S53 family peptidase [Pseudomonas vlassakiae]|uniref:S8/S53 family peptidase n=1 Tax=Pseudomonas vlassakiae TaxID=485888 RepID=UPI0021C98AA3|nr:S8/S53 family peptidase [Pseudomonas vlassakiae]MCU0125676.1 S8/S53 family peptidase [Pseudomonas vlassakiae]
MWFLHMLILAAAVLSCAKAEGALRIDGLAPKAHGYVHDVHQQCMQVQGMGEFPPTVVVNGSDLPAHRVERHARSLCFSLGKGSPSGPIWLRQAGRTSNAVWFTAQRSSVRASAKGHLVKIADRVVTAVDLVSLILSEDLDGLEQARRIARHNDLEIVGAIPALNVFQFRLPARTLAERNEIVSRLQADSAVMGVVVEDDNLEALEDPEREIEPPDHQGWVANNVQQAIDVYEDYLRGHVRSHVPRRVRVGVIEKGVNFDSTDFLMFTRPCTHVGACLYARHSLAANAHGSVVSGILAARVYQAGNLALLSRLGAVGGRFDIIVDRGAAAGVTARIAASANLVEDGVRVLNWSWGVHRMGTLNFKGEPIDVNVRSNLAMAGYQLLLERFFHWLERQHPNVLVINSAGNSASTTDDHLPASLAFDQLLVVGGHQRSRIHVNVADPRFATPRRSSNVGARIDISAAACPNPPRSTLPRAGRGGGCGTSYAAALVTGVAAAMVSINPELTPKQIKRLLRQSALPMSAGTATRIEPTRPIKAGRRSESGVSAVGQFARLDMLQALKLAIESHPGESSE